MKHNLRQLLLAALITASQVLAGCAWLDGFRKSETASVSGASRTPASCDWSKPLELFYIKDPIGFLENYIDRLTDNPHDPRNVEEEKSEARSRLQRIVRRESCDPILQSWIVAIQLNEKYFADEEYGLVRTSEGPCPNRNCGLNAREELQKSFEIDGKVRGFLRDHTENNSSDRVNINGKSRFFVEKVAAAVLSRKRAFLYEANEDASTDAPNGVYRLEGFPLLLKHIPDTQVRASLNSELKKRGIIVEPENKKKILQAIGNMFADAQTRMGGNVIDWVNVTNGHIQGMAGDDFVRETGVFYTKDEIRSKITAANLVPPKADLIKLISYESGTVPNSALNLLRHFGFTFQNEEYVAGQARSSDKVRLVALWNDEAYYAQYRVQSARVVETTFHETISNRQLPLPKGAYASARPLRDWATDRKERRALNRLTNEEMIKEWHKRYGNERITCSTGDYGVVDKREKLLRVYSSQGEELASMPVAIGEESGDFSTIAYEERTVRGTGEIKTNKVTSAGVFSVLEKRTVDSSRVRDVNRCYYHRLYRGKLIALGRADTGKELPVLALHQVPVSSTFQNRRDALSIFGQNGFEPEMLNITNGCINVLGSHYDKIATHLASGCRVYVLPENSNNSETPVESSLYNLFYRVEDGDIRMKVFVRPEGAAQGIKESDFEGDPRLAADQIQDANRFLGPRKISLFVSKEIPTAPSDMENFGLDVADGANNGGVMARPTIWSYADLSHPIRQAKYQFSEQVRVSETETRTDYKFRRGEYIKDNLIKTTKNKSETINEYLKTLVEDKPRMMRVYNLTNDEYNEIALYAFAILGVETEFGQNWRYHFKLRLSSLLGDLGTYAGRIIDQRKDNAEKSGNKAQEDIERKRLMSLHNFGETWLFADQPVPNEVWSEAKRAVERNQLQNSESWIRLVYSEDFKAKSANEKWNIVSSDRRWNLFTQDSKFATDWSSLQRSLLNLRVSRGLTQIKVIPNKYLKYFYQSRGQNLENEVQVELTKAANTGRFWDDHLKSPKNAAWATVGFLEERMREMRSQAEKNQRRQMGILLDNENLFDHIAYYYNGGIWQIRTGVAQPELNVYTQKLQNYLNHVRLVEERMPFADLRRMVRGQYQSIRNEYKIEDYCWD